MTPKSKQRVAPKDEIRRVLITVITYKRPLDLERMLKSLMQLKTGMDHRIVVVDNDPESSAESVVSQYAQSVDYVLEPEPGIAAARNRCIERIQDGDDAIVFLDDDETVTDDWLDELVKCAELYSAPVVAGHVISILPSDAPEWIRSGNFFQRRIRPTGASDGLPATNNVLVRTSALRSNPQIRFDHHFSVTGGSDSDFFFRLKAAGVRFVWCEAALVYEYVQTDRITFRWLARRFTRGGETYARMLRRTNARWRIVARGLIYISVGAALAPVTGLIRKDLRGKNLILLGRGFGLIRGSIGLHVQEYSRSANNKNG